MSLLSKIGLCAATFTALVVLSGAASAADEGFCRDYAREAMQQAHAAFDNRRCGWDVRQNPARWNLDYEGQKNWCRHTSRKNVDRERNARTDTLARCQQSDWGPGGPGPGGPYGPGPGGPGPGPGGRR